MSDSRYLHLLRQDCPVPPGTHVVLYTRDSGGEEQDKSVKQQLEAAEEYCQHFGLVLAHVYCDESEKATAVEKRDAFAQMMSDLRQRFSILYDPAKREKRSKTRPFGVLCWKSNRLGRDLLHTRHIKSDLRLRGVTIISLMPIIETGNAGLDALIETFYEYQDQQTLEEISDNAKRGLAQLVTMRDTNPEFLEHNPNWQPTGHYLGILPGGVPTGFKAERIRVGTYKRKRGKQSGEPRIVQRIHPDPETWERCRLAWQMRHDGASIRDIMAATHLFKVVSSYASFFDNLIYTGTLEYGGHRIPDFVPAMIPMEWWEVEQQRKAERGKKARGERVDPQFEPRRVSSRHLLSGILFCGHNAAEEHPMLADCIPAKKGQRGHWDFYICSHKKNSRDVKCQSKRVSARLLEASVIDALIEQVLTHANLGPIADAITQHLVQTDQSAQMQLKALEAELRQLERQIDHLLEAVENMGLSPSLREKLTKREADRERMRSQIAQLRKLVVKASDIPRVSTEVLDGWIRHMQHTLQGDDSATARRALRHLVSRIVIRDGQGTIYYTFPVDVAQQGRIDLGEENVDLRGFEPLTSTVRL